MADLTLSVVIKWFLARFAIRAAFVDPPDIQAMIDGVLIHVKTMLRITTEYVMYDLNTLEIRM